jgi:hypothetical protein
MLDSALFGVSEKRLAVFGEVLRVANDLRVAADELLPMGSCGCCKSG